MKARAQKDLTVTLIVAHFSILARGSTFSVEMDPSNIQESKAAEVHGIFVGEVSPIKVSRKCADRKYFEANLTDGIKTVRMVSFEPNLRKAVEDANKDGREIAVRKCTVKRGLGNDFEILANHKTEIMSSPKKFKISDEAIEKQVAVGFSCSDLGTIEELRDLKEFQRVNIIGKVQSISAPEEIKGKSGTVLLKQDFALADCTDVCRGVTWQEEVNVLKEEHSYKLMNVTVRSFNGAKYVSVGEKSEIQEIGNIGGVVEKDTFDGSGKLKVFQGEIVTVTSVEMYTSCRNCNAKVESSEGIIVCAKCNSKMKASKCAKKGVAHVIVEDSAQEEHKVTIFSEVIDSIVIHANLSSSNVDVAEKLLLAPALCYTVNSKDIVTSVTKS